MADLEDPGGFGFFVGFLIPVLGSRVTPQTVGRLQDRNLLSHIPSIALGTGRRLASEAFRVFPEDEAAGYVLLCSAYPR